MTYVDKTIVCTDCQAEFVHSATDQQRYAERGFTNEPKRCPTCREKRKSAGAGGGRPRGGSASPPSRMGDERPPRQRFMVTCAQCGKQTEVPFKPTEGRPVYCRDCYQAHRPAH